MNDLADRPRDGRTGKRRSLFVNAGLVLVAFLAVSAFQSRNMLSADGQSAPDLRAITLDGEPYAFEDAAGRPALVYFFAPWCRICAASSGNLVRLRRWREPRELEIVAVALDWATAGEVRDYAVRHELNMTVLLGDAGIGRQWQVRAYPSYYVLDREHRIARRDIGYTTQLGLWWRTWIVP